MWVLLCLQPAKVTPPVQAQPESSAPLPLLPQPSIPGPRCKWDRLRSLPQPRKAPYPRPPTSASRALSLGAQRGCPAPQHPHASLRAGERRDGGAASPTDGWAPRRQEH